MADKTGAVSRPVKELKNFVKVELQPQEEKTVEMELDKRSFAWYCTELADWYTATAESYENSWQQPLFPRDIRLRKTVKVISSRIFLFP